jgi:hypothetical protein
LVSSVTLSLQSRLLSVRVLSTVQEVESSSDAANEIMSRRNKALEMRFAGIQTRCEQVSVFDESEHFRLMAIMGVASGSAEQVHSEFLVAQTRQIGRWPSHCTTGSTSRIPKRGLPLSRLYCYVHKVESYLGLSATTSIASNSYLMPLSFAPGWRLLLRRG